MLAASTNTLPSLQASAHMPVLSVCAVVSIAV